MRHLDLATHVWPFETVYYHTDGDGYIVWRLGTGGNVELLHLHANESGGGGRLLKVMLRRLADSPPYCTVFGFTRACNERAMEFYLSAGFSLSPVRGVYADGEAVVFSQTYKRLVELHHGT